MNSDTDDLLFVHYWKLIARLANQNAHDKGFYDEPRTFGDEIALAHTELSEAFEGFRHGNPPSDKIPDFSAVEEEYADLWIRIAETAYEHNFRVAEAVLAKMAYNRTRPYKHGKVL